MSSTPGRNSSLASNTPGCTTGPEALPPTVNGALGHSISLSPEIAGGLDIGKIEWRKTSLRSKIIKFSKGNITYFGTEEYGRRITFHPKSLSLEIRDLRREDAGDYEVTVITRSGTEILSRIRLEVYAGTGAAAGTVTGARGHSVSLPAGITVTPDITGLVWRRKSPRFKIAEYSNGKINYFNINYKGRVTLHPRNFSLEIRDLRREDAGEYEATFGTSSGDETQARVRLEVYEPVAGTQIKAENITETCNFTLTCYVTSGDSISFTWWREAVGNDSTHHLVGHGKTIQVHHTAEVGDVVYRCEARNPVSEGTAQIRLKNICKQTTSGECQRANQV
ncbi:SLAM family member 5-like [Amblyraja radiata]|uniref:SLAM family member 5-like n=1 Tax=Amblyraja radiata TaxID=386614 RepID=UPI00140340F2|nr:SLAM family member 5-like [Amblyraja radiata]